MGSEKNSGNYALLRFVKTRHIDFFIHGILVGAILAVYWQVSGFDFISYDDIAYVTKNEVVSNGLTLQGIAWAFTQFHSAS